MEMEQHTIVFTTLGRGTQDITTDVAKVVSNSVITIGLCHIFLQHTSASIMICENYDAQVRKDLESFLLRLIPDGDPMFKHVTEGKDDMPAHIRNILTQTEITIPIHEAKLALGAWQGIYLYEHKYQLQKRNLIVSVLGV
ncbi:MAG: secondary thiamine-phosphate synthase enzyme YjbQ [Legionellaceae bacterium]|nr:secondary thiamine-phosphate synthase enzyme YjbQ [Legionellaceae bacterium]